MHVIEVDNVNQALPAGLELLLTHGSWEDSRAGRVLVYPTPVTTAYRNPTWRVLLSPVRDANPFFHLAEALWMLAGRQDAEFLNHFVQDFGRRFADDGMIHGAYGYRWRCQLEFDQLDYIIDQLQHNPSTRQMVLQMWDGQLGEWGANDLAGKWKDRPCNTHAYFLVRRRQSNTTHVDGTPVLDMTVLCRSNDLIWGAYGANAVHFSILQEYLASKIGIGVGTYYQVSNNFHAYESELGRLAKRGGCEVRQLTNALRSPTWRALPPPHPIMINPSTFEQELGQVLRAASGHPPHEGLENTWLRCTALPLMSAHLSYRAGDLQGALQGAGQSDICPHWSTACTEWLTRRIEARQRRAG